MRSLQEAYLICLAERKAGNKKYYQQEPEKLLKKMEAIRALSLYKGEYSYSDRKGNYIFNKKYKKLQRQREKKKEQRLLQK